MKGRIVTTKLSTTGRLSEIVELHELAMDDAKRSIERAIRVGELLSEQKSELNHGEWIPWVEENLPFDRRQASNYMRVFSNQHELNGNSTSHLAEAVQMLATPNPVSERPDVEHPVLEQPSGDPDEEWEEVAETVEVTRVELTSVLDDAKIFDKWDKILRDLNSEILECSDTVVGAWIYRPFYTQSMKKLRSVLAGFKPVEICCDSGCDKCHGTGYLSKMERDKK